MARGIVVALALGLVSVSVRAAAQPPPASAPAATLTIDHAALDADRGILAIHGSGLGSHIVVTLGGEVLALLAGATNERMEAVAPARVLDTVGTYRISVVDPTRQTTTAFVVTSQPTVEAAASLSPASRLTTRRGSNDSARSQTSVSSNAAALAAGVSATRAAADAGLLGPQIIESSGGSTAVGYQALEANAGGRYNTAAGMRALGSNTSGNDNTATGALALEANTTGIGNTATGRFALASNITGSSNTATGHQALLFSTASENTANGAFALWGNTVGARNAAVGFESLVLNVNGNENVAMGHGSLRGNTSGNNNTGVGTNALRSNTLGDENTAIGTSALVLNTVGRWNTALGTGAAAANATGIANVGVGQVSLYNNSSGSFNTAVGYAAGYFGGGSNNVFLGANVWGSPTDNNTIRLGLPYDTSTGDGQNRTFIAGIYGTQLTSPAQQVFIDINGQLGILGPPVVSQPISGPINAVPRDQALEARIEALDALVREQQATIARLSALADEHATALKALRGASSSTTRKR